MDVLTRVPVREQEPAVRAANFEEVCLGYNEEEAMAEGCPLLKLQKCTVHERAVRYPSIFRRLSQKSKKVILRSLIM